jgi:hypothetical protein
VEWGQAGWVVEGLTPLRFHPNTFMRRSNDHSAQASYPPEAARSLNFSSAPIAQKRKQRLVVARVAGESSRVIKEDIEGS